MDMERKEEATMEGRFRSESPIIMSGVSSMYVNGGYNLISKKNTWFRHTVFIQSIQAIGICGLSIEYLCDWLAEVITDWDIDWPITANTIAMMGMSNIFAIYKGIAASTNEEPPECLRGLFS